MADAYEQFADADRNRIAWVAVFRRFDKLIAELDPLAPKLAKKMRERFFATAELPMASPRVGEEVCKELENELSFAWPLSWSEAVEIAVDCNKSPYQVMEEHRLHYLNEES